MSSAYGLLATTLAERGHRIDRVEAALRAQRVETPSWAFGNSGTRFAVFPQPGVPRTTLEKLEDAAEVHRRTGVAPSVALHIPWDKVEDYGALRESAAALGLRLGAINPNLFQEPDYRFGSVCHPDERVRRKAIDHLLECIEIAGLTGSDSISLWLADGTNYPGQDSLSARRERLVDSLQEVYAALPEGVELLVEYKLYEPAFYSTDLADWGSALTLCQELGPRASVLVDLGHHAQGVNIEQIVSLLQRLRPARRLPLQRPQVRRRRPDRRLDRPVPAVPDLRRARLRPGRFDSGVRLTIDQSHNIEPKIEAMIQSVVNLQEAYAKALLVDAAALEQAQVDGDILGANRILLDAFATDVRPLCAKVSGGPRRGRGPGRSLPRRRVRRRRCRETGRRHPAGWQ